MVADTTRASRRLPDRGDLVQVAAFIVAINVIGGLPGVFSSPDTAWFRSLEKPWFYPPEIAFPVVWTALFTLLGIALWLIWRSDAPGRGLALGLFAVQMLFNVVWTPAFFTLEALGGAFGIIVVLWLSIIATMAAFARVDRRGAALLVPYLAWVTFAAVLNFELWRLNG